MISKILVAIDGSDQSIKAAEYAVDITNRYGAQLSSEVNPIMSILETYNTCSGILIVFPIVIPSIGLDQKYTTMTVVCQIHTLMYWVVGYAFCGFLQ